jgi:hypothetical protein
MMHVLAASFNRPCVEKAVISIPVSGRIIVR